MFSVTKDRLQPLQPADLQFLSAPFEGVRP